MKIRFILIAVCFLFSLPGQADEGMWMLGNLNKQTRQTMKELGLQMSVNKLYNTKRPSLKDAVVSFGGFCSGVVVSGDGLVFTNHHCGFSSIQQHSSVEHDYLKDGFVARNLSEELPNPELYVRFLLHQQDVTRRVLGAVKPDMNESERTSVVDSVMLVIGEEVSRKDSTLIGIVDAYYGGNEFWLSVYRDYNDVRLVFAPPSSVGKFGWDTDNWVWPRHTGDFAVFRIYAGKDNRPADYSPDNVPYHPEYVAPRPAPTAVPMAAPLPPPAIAPIAAPATAPPPPPIVAPCPVLLMFWNAAHPVVSSAAAIMAVMDPLVVLIVVSFCFT